MLNFLANKIIKYAKTKPVRIITQRDTNQHYMIRYYMMFENRPWWFPFNIVCHNVLLSDDAELHSHPWPFYITLILKGGYWESTIKGKFWRKPGHIGIHGGNYLHRLEVDPEKAQGETWTLFLMGPKTKTWHFINENNELEQWDLYLNRKKSLNSNMG